MKKTVLFVLPFVLMSFVLGVGFLQQSRGMAALSRELEAVEGENRGLRAERNGLREANADLREHLEASRRLAVLLPPPRVEAVAMDFAELPPVLEEAFDAEPVDADVPDRVLTAEEIAAREAELAAREARRAEWEARREAMRERAIAGTQDRRAFFEQVSLEGLAPEYVAGHQRLLEAMDEVQVRIQALGDPSLSREAQRELRQELGELGRELNGLMGMQREILLNDYAQAMGFQGADARVFIDSIETIQEMTSLRGLIWGGGRGGGGPPGGGR